VNVLGRIANELLGLFVEDRLFAIALAVWIAAIAAAAAFGFGPAHFRGVALFAGLVVILLTSVARAARP
jgi:hypothetical protein